MHKTLKTDARRPAIILAMCVATLVVLAVMGHASTGSATPKRTTTTRIQEDDPRWDCGRHGNRVCGAKVDAQASAERQEKATGNVCTLTVQNGPTPPWGWKVDCVDATPVPQKVTPRITG